MAHCSVLILQQSWHTPRMGSYTVCVLVSGLLCHWHCYDCREHVPPNRGRQDAGLTAEKKRKGHLTAPYEAQYFFHKTSAHSAEHDGTSQCPSLLFTHKKKHFSVEAPWGSRKSKWHPQEAGLQASLSNFESGFQLCETNRRLIQKGQHFVLRQEFPPVP